MPSIEQLSKLFKALAHKDLDAAEQQAIAIAVDEERKGHTTAAQRLKGALSANGAQSIVDPHGPVAKNGTAALLTGALSQRTRTVCLDDVVMRPEVRRVLEELVRELKGHTELRNRGISRRSKLIFHGPPGCGKTLTAQALANALQLPLYVVRFDAVVSSYLGQTATHLRQLFQFAESTRCVLLFDEIDALGKRRGSPSDVGELDRIVIALAGTRTVTDSRLRHRHVQFAGQPRRRSLAQIRLNRQICAPTKAAVLRFSRTKAKFFHLQLTKTLAATTSRLHSYADVEKAIEDAARREALRDL